MGNFAQGYHCRCHFSAFYQADGIGGEIASNCQLFEGQTVFFAEFADSLTYVAPGFAISHGFHLYNQYIVKYAAKLY